MFSFFNIKCDKAHEICNKSQYNEATFSEKLKLNWHLLTCKICRLYTKQNSTITSICKEKAEDVKMQENNLSDLDKEQLKEKMEKLLQQ